MKIYLDDVREPPIGWLLVRDYYTMIDLINSPAWAHVHAVSLDHDLGLPDGQDGTAVANAIEARFHLDGIAPISWAIHSANPVGAKKMQATFEAMEYSRFR